MRRLVLLLPLLLLGAADVQIDTGQPDLKIDTGQPNLQISSLYKGLLLYVTATSGYTKGVTVSDRTPYDNHGTLNGTPPVPDATGVTFDGDDYLDFGDDQFSFTDGLGNDKPFSVVVWLVPAAMSNLHVANVFSNVTGREWAFAAGSTPGVVSATLYTDASNRICKQPASGYSDIGATVMYAFSYDGSKTFGGIKLYRNGAETTSVSDCGLGSYTGMADTNTTLKIGWNTFSYSSMKVISVRIYDRAVSAAEMSRLHLEGAL